MKALLARFQPMPRRPLPAGCAVGAMHQVGTCMHAPGAYQLGITRKSTEQDTSSSGRTTLTDTLPNLRALKVHCGLRPCLLIERVHYDTGDREGYDEHLWPTDACRY